ncbi:hypothetical protein C8R44DRAFT_988705 [Mycena epipterygia]|nr:hypothetical protein C8R44DRAFT_988705 [Mycena epipterygia]
MAPPHLDADILSHIFALSDVYTILSLSRVNKLFHSAAFTKQLWLSVARNLASRWLIDPPADEILEALSTDELVDEVKCGVITVHELPDGHLLPDGRHIVSYNRTDAGGAFYKGVECWEVKTGGVCGAGQHITTSCTSRHLISVAEDRKRWYLWSMECTSITPSSSFKLIWRQETHTMSSTSPSTQLSRPEYKFLETSSLDTALFPGHIVLGYSVSGSVFSHTDHGRIYSIASFHRIWRPISDFDVNTPSDIGRIGSVVINLAGNNVVRVATPR